MKKKIEDDNLQKGEIKQKTNWKPTIISIIVGILIAVSTTWYSINSNQVEAKKAEQERVKKVKQNLVAIIEEHIVNKDTLNIDILNRIVHNRTKEENLNKTLTLFDLLSQAEYNIQNSSHLSFQKKKEYATIINALFKNVIPDSTVNFSNFHFSNEANKLLKYIEESKRAEAKKTLSLLLEKYEEKIYDLENNKNSVKFNINDILSNQKFLFTLSISLILYVIVLYILRFYLRQKKRKIAYRMKLNSFYNEKRKILLDELEDLKEKLLNANSDKERQVIQEKMNFIYKELNELEKEEYYHQQKI